MTSSKRDMELQRRVREAKTARFAREREEAAANTPATPAAVPPRVDARTLDHESYRAYLQARGLDPNLAGEERLHPPRTRREPVIEDQRNVQAKQRADYFASLPPFDARTATPEQTNERLKAIGIDTGWGRSMFLEQTPPVPDGVSLNPHDATNAVRQSVQQAARVSLTTKQLNAQRAKRPLDVRKLTPAEYDAYMQRRGVGGPGANGWQVSPDTVRQGN